MVHIGLGRAMFLCISPCVTPWIPSAPTTRSPVYKVLSAQCTVTRDLPLSIWTTFFPSSTLAGAFRNKTDSRACRSITKNPYPNLCESALAELTHLTQDKQPRRKSSHINRTQQQSSFQPRPMHQHRRRFVDHLPQQTQLVQDASAIG